MVTRADVTRLLAILNSVCFDWLVRRRVETQDGVWHSQRPSRFRTSEPQAHASSKLAGRLSCVDDRYEDWARRIGIAGTGTVTETERAVAEAEIDALIAHAYGLTRNELILVFSDFVEAALPTASVSSSSTISTAWHERLAAADRGPRAVTVDRRRAANSVWCEAPTGSGKAPTRGHVAAVHDTRVLSQPDARSGPNCWTS